MTTEAAADLIDGWLAPDCAALRLYAAGGVSWHELQQRGFADYVAVLGGLGALGLQPPMASTNGSNAEERARGRARLRQILRDLT